jgi:uncharacterized protein (DUF58 family)
MTIFSLLKSFHFRPRMYGLVVICSLAFCFSYAFPVFYSLAQVVLALSITILLADIVLLYVLDIQIRAERKTGNMLFLGDQNTVSISLQSFLPLPLNAILYDELPVQLQERDFAIRIELRHRESQLIEYTITPVSRGDYHFGRINIHVFSPLGLISRNIIGGREATVPCFPSIPQMKQFELRAFSRASADQGIKRIQRIGHSFEFEQIKSYVEGDNIRSINWKATSRRGNLMVNQYQDERSQQVYCIIDKGRSMLMPFNGLSLLDYAINTSLVISNIALKKYDKAGLISFSDKLGTCLPAERSRTQLRKILRALYAEKERETEADYTLLLNAIRNMGGSRSLLLLFSNFDSIYAMERILPVLRKINSYHLLVVIMFQDTELEDFSLKDAATTEDIYIQTLANKLLADKQTMVQLLRKFGIQVLLTRPEELSLRTVNKYLEIKSKGLI